MGQSQAFTMATCWVLCAMLCSLLIDPCQAEASTTPAASGNSTTAASTGTSKPGRALHAVLAVMGVGLGLSLLLAIAVKWRSCYEHLRGFRHQRLAEGDRAHGHNLGESGLAVVSGPGLGAAGGVTRGAGEDGGDDGFIEDGYLDDAIFKIDSDSDMEC
ncbi:type III endosome membrane protein TEMP isoform X2 [Petromyzon marinus]|uniref:type III endosome membrane protein TEMP isoform X2 n=1 Tax=Petromyzon marinus TaxID=7757 RepID=UPI003F724A7B